MRGYGNHDILRGAEYLGEAITFDGDYEMRDYGGFPAVYKIDDGNWIKGELYSVDDKILAHTDRLEGHPDWYKREKVDVLVGELLEDAEMYVMQREVRGRPVPVVNSRQSWRNKETQNGDY